MKIMKINGINSNESKKFLSNFLGYIKVCDDGRFDGLVIDGIINEDLSLEELTIKNKTNLIKGSFSGKAINFTIFKDIDLLYDYKLIKQNSSYYGFNSKIFLNIYKKHIDLKSSEPFLYSKVSLVDDNENIETDLDLGLYKFLEIKDPLFTKLSSLMDKYSSSTLTDTFYEKHLVYSKDVFMKN